MFYLIGLGLGDAEDITVKGLNIIKTCKRVYLEAYTSILTGASKEALELLCANVGETYVFVLRKQPLLVQEEFYGREVILADRDMVEQESDSILENATEENIAFLVVGDPFGATTHTDLALRAKQKGIDYKVVHNASIMNAIGCCGLQLYSFGETVSIVFWTDTWRPSSYYEKIQQNRERGLHTLCLLDIKVKEQSIENLMRGRKIFEPPRYMTADQAASQLLEIVEDKKQAGDKDLAFTEGTVCVGVARVGCDDQKILAGTLKEMSGADLGPPLHSLVIAGHTHPLELDMLKQFAIDTATFSEKC